MVSNRHFQFLHQCFSLPESDDFRYKSRRLEKTICSRAEGCATSCPPPRLLRALRPAGVESVWECVRETEREGERERESDAAPATHVHHIKVSNVWGLDRARAYEKCQTMSVILLMCDVSKGSGCGVWKGSALMPPPNASCQCGGLRRRACRWYQISIFNSFVSASARRNSATCGSNQGDCERRFAPALRAAPSHAPPDASCGRCGLRRRACGCGEGVKVWGFALLIRALRRRACDAITSHLNHGVGFGQGLCQ